MRTKIPLTVKTKVSDPGRSLNELFSKRPVTARIVDWTSSADTPRAWATHVPTAVGSFLGSLDAQESMSGWMSWVATREADSSGGAERRAWRTAEVPQRHGRCGHGGVAVEIGGENKAGPDDEDHGAGGAGVLQRVPDGLHRGSLFSAEAGCTSSATRLCPAKL